MSKRWYWFPVFVLALILLMLCLAVMFFSFAPRPPEQAYTLRAQNGQVVLCYYGESSPIAYYEIYTVLLPENDVEALENGIDVENRKDALRLLEDFGL